MTPDTHLDILRPFAESGVLGAAEIQATEAAARLFPDTPTEVLLAYSMAIRAPIWGHVCVDLATVADNVTIDNPDIDLAWPEPESWLAKLVASPLVRQMDSPESNGLKRWPLVIDGSRLYLDRYARYEAMAARFLLERIAEPSDSLDHGKTLDLFFPSDPTDRQRQAAESALSNQVTIIVGGPGTGKTRTVARMLAAVLTQASEAGQPVDVGLAAPTGKAAARMTEAIHGELSQLDLDPEVAAQLAEAEATTIHRLLGSRGSHRFAHDRLNPLPHDMVVIDETSMVSLPLMARLFDAVRPEAKIVLVGDPFQLASVEAGAVLGDLSASGPDPSGSVSALLPVTVVLDRVHRFGSDSGIAALAGAIKVGDADAAVSILRDPDWPDVSLVDPGDQDSVAQLLSAASRHAEATVTAAQNGDAIGALGASSQFKILGATRHGPLGVNDWTERITAGLGGVISGADRYNPWYIGRPVMATQNDYLSGVFNGDVGVVVDDGDTRSVAFPTSDGVELVPASRLGEVQTWWAMTIHKSQGSEFDSVVLTLPTPGSRVLSRELLYTGVTRARSRVTIVGTEAVVRTTVTRGIQRTSGLASRLAI